MIMKARLAVRRILAALRLHPQHDVMTSERGRRRSGQILCHTDAPEYRALCALWNAGFVSAGEIPGIVDAVAAIMDGYRQLDTEAAVVLAFNEFKARDA